MRKWKEGNGVLDGLLRPAHGVSVPPLGTLMVNSESQISRKCVTRHRV